MPEQTNTEAIPGAPVRRWTETVQPVAVPVTPAAPTAEETVRATLEDRAVTAMTNNRTYIALASPTAAQNAAQIKALTQQNNGIIRLLLARLDGTN